MLYALRERFRRISIKVGIVFSKARLSPNHWMLLTLIPILFAFYFLVNEHFAEAALLFLLAAFFDLVDGSVARVTGKVTQTGAYLDTIMDRYVEAIIIFGLLFVSLPGYYLPAYIWLFIYLFGTMMTTYAKAAAKEKLDKDIKGGLLERAERMIILFFGILLADYSTAYLTYIIVFLAVVSNVTALQRMVKAVK